MAGAAPPGERATVTVAGLLLAAGAGRRYGMPKALVAGDDGRLLVESAAGTLRAGGCDPVVVVLGAAAEEVLARAASGAADLADAEPVVNPDWATGMGSSLRAGLSALGRAGGGIEAVCVLLVDTPGITAGAVRRIAALGAPGALAVATYHAQPGHPVLIGRDHWAAVAAMAVGDVGARRYLARHPELLISVACEDIAVGDDLDVPPARTGGPPGLLNRPMG